MDPKKDQKKNNLFIIGLWAPGDCQEQVRELLHHFTDLSASVSIIIAQPKINFQKKTDLKQAEKQTSWSWVEVKRDRVLLPGRIYFSSGEKEVSISGKKICLRKDSSFTGSLTAADRFFSSLASSFRNRAIAILLPSAGKEGAHGIRTLKEASSLLIKSDLKIKTPAGKSGKFKLSKEQGPFLSLNDTVNKVKKYISQIGPKTLPPPKKQNWKSDQENKSNAGLNRPQGSARIELDAILRELLIARAKLDAANRRLEKRNPLEPRFDGKEIQTKSHDLGVNLEALIENSHDLLTLFDAQGTIKYISPAVERILGYTNDDNGLLQVMDWILPEDLEFVQQRSIEILSNPGIPFHSVIRNRKKDGSIIWVEGTVTNMLSVKEVNAIVANFRDITQAKLTADRLAKSESELAEAQRLAKVGNWNFDFTNNKLTWSDELHRIFGTDKESFTGTRDSFLQFVAEPDRAYVGQASLLAQRGGQFYEIEYRIRTTTGETRVVNEIGNVQRDENGKLVRVYGTTQDISERKKAEEEKELERMNKEALINVTDDLIWSVDRELKLIAANAAFIKKIKLETKITLRPGDELLMRDVYSEDHLLFWGDLYRRALAGEKFRKEVYSQGTIERAPDWQEIRFHPIHKNGEVMGIACYARDITERVNFLKELEKSNERFKYVSKATNDFTWDWDLITGDVTRPGNRLEVQFGYDPVGAPEVDEFWNTHAHPEDWAKVTRKRNAIFKNPFENYWEDDYRFLKPNGDYGYVNDRGYILRNEEGYPVRMIGASRDISRQKKAEEELKRLSLIAKETVNIVVILDPAGRIQWVNDAFTRITEFSFEEAAGKKPCEFLHGEKTAPETKKYIEDQLGEKRPFECEIIHYTKSGLPFWIKIQFQPMFNNKGILDHYFAIETDITDIKKSEEILKSSEKKYRYLFNNNPACIFIWDIDTLEVLEVNDTAVEQYGYTREEMLRNSMLEIRPKEEYDKLRAFAKSAKDDPFFKAIDTWKHIHKTGELMYMNIASHRILYKGKPAMLALANNVTERIMLEQELEEEKLQKQMEITKAVIAAQEQERAELGRELHDNINQILATTRFYMDYAITDEKKRIELIKQSKDFISTTINEIRNLSKSLLPPSLGEISLLEAFNDMVNNITKVHGLKISADWEHFDENLLHDDLKLAIFRILQEQLNNILKHAKASFVFISLKEGDNGIGLTVKDDGIGFDPTVKRNGLGLKNISSRAGLFNGVVELVSEPSKGVELRIQFPYFPHNERAIDIFRNKEKH